MRIYIYLAALSGYLFHAGVTMWRQDMMGLDKYIMYLQAAWVDLHPIWGFTVMALAIFFFARIRDAAMSMWDYQCNETRRREELLAQRGGDHGSNV